MLVGTVNGKPNRFAALFSAIIFKPASASAKTYDENGRKSRKVANVLLEFANPTTGKGSGIFVKGRIAAVQTTGQRKSKAEFKFFAAQNMGQCIVTDDEQATRDMAAYAKHVEAKYADYRKQLAISGVGEDSEGVELDDISL